MRLKSTQLRSCWLYVALAASPCAAQQVVYVDRDRPPGGDGTSWQTAYKSLQDALTGQNPLSSGTDLSFWIAEGAYRPDQGVGLTLGDRTLSFVLEDGMTLLGGFDGTETSSSQRDPDAHPVILSGDLQVNDGPNFTNIGDNSHHIISSCSACSGSAIVDGVTIRGGNSNGSFLDLGAGIIAGDDIQMTFVNCRIESNSADRGGAIFALSGNLVFEDCKISGNRGISSAGGLWAFGFSNIVLENTNFSGNLSPGHDLINEVNSRILANKSDLESVRNVGFIGAGENGTAGEFSTAVTYQQEDSILAGVMEFDLGGDAPGVNQDFVDIGAEANLRGVAKLSLIGNYMPGGPEIFELLQSGFITHEFDIGLMPHVDGGLAFQLAHQSSQFVEASLKELAQVLAFEEPSPAGFVGVATDIALGDFDENDFPEAAMTVPDPGGGGAPGEALILVNDGTSGGVWQGFSVTVNVPVGTNPVALAIGDLDGDTVNDFVVANYDDDTVSVLLNNRDLLGPNPFTRTDYPTGGAGPLDVALGDTDFQNGLDIIVANESGEVTVLANFGGGKFDFAAILEEPGSPGTVDPGDLDNDKDLDFLIGDNDPPSVLVAINLGDNEFEFTREFPLGGQPTVANAVDLNGDMQEDLTAVVQDLGVLAIVLNEGGGSYSPVINVPIGDDVQSMATADFDDDGDTDIATVVRDGNGDRVIQILRNDSTGSQLAYTLIEPFGLEESPLAVVAGDLNRDFIPDLVSPGSTSIPLAGTESKMASRVSEPFVPCATDTDASGAVDVLDLLAVLGAWGPCPAPCPPDTDNSGVVDVLDLLAVLGAWGNCP